MWWLLVACSGTSPAPAPTPAPAPAVTPAPAAEPAVAPAPGSHGALKDHMQEHYTAVHVAFQSLVDGEMDAARERLRWLAEHPSAKDLPPGTEARVAALKEIAQTAADAPLYTDVAAGIGALGAQCGGCHTDAKVTVTIDMGQGPPPSTELLPHMARHRWAVGAMWAGLVSTSPDLWRLGAEALGDAPLPKGAFDVPGVPKESWEAAEEAHGVAKAAIGLTDPDQQAEAFAKVVSACARCHSEMRGE